MWRAKFFSILPQVLEDYPTARWVFLTLTVKNVPVEELRVTLTHMNSSWSRLCKRTQFPAIGWVKTIEVTRSLSGDAHPHFHCLMMVPSNYFGRNYIKHNEWVALWRESLRVNYDPVVNVKALHRQKNATEETQETFMLAICEVLKYSVKESDLITDPRWLGELARQMHNTRAIAVGGALKNYFSDQEPEDLVNGQTSDEDTTKTGAKLSFSWEPEDKRYRQMELEPVESSNLLPA